MATSVPGLKACGPGERVHKSDDRFDRLPFRNTEMRGACLDMLCIINVSLLEWQTSSIVIYSIFKLATE